jgi:signal transduction histidine kinase
VAPPDDELRDLRRAIVPIALVVVLTWSLVGLPYSLSNWLLDPTQLRWVLACYAWEVPVAALLGPVLFAVWRFRTLERRWAAAFAAGEGAAALERGILDFPVRLAAVILVTSVVGYGIGALQLRWFAELPVEEMVKIVALGVATGLIGALFVFLYLEARLARVLEHFGPDAVPVGRRVPLQQKVFACAIVMAVAPLILLGTALYTRAELLLEEAIGTRLLDQARALADEPAAAAADAPWWRARRAAMHLGAGGGAFLVRRDGTVAGGAGTPATLAAYGFRPVVAADVRAAADGWRVDRVGTQRVVAFAAAPRAGVRAVAVAYRRDFGGALATMFRRGLAIFAAATLLALAQALLFSRRLARPLEMLTARAAAIARAPAGPWDAIPVHTNDEVGELADALNRMIARLAAARDELERRIAEATRSVAALYEVTRTATSTLELADVLRLVAEKTLAFLDLRRLVVLVRPADGGDGVDAYTAGAGTAGSRLEVDVDLDALCGAGPPRVRAAFPLPVRLANHLDAPRVLVLPLRYGEEPLGVMLAGVDGDAAVDLELAGAIGRQAASALANARLFETVRRQEAALRRLSHARAEVQEATLRSLSRELHDGIGQVLTVVSLELGLLERTNPADRAALRAGLQKVRDQVSRLQHDVRAMCQLLRPPMLDFGLVPTLRWLAEQFATSSGVAVEVATPPEETRLPPEIEVVLYRLAQEALTNVARHARATHVRVALQAGEARAVLEVEDDGVGFDPERLRRTPAAAGVGLLGMRERAAHFGGTLEIRSRPGAGTRIAVTVPLADAGEGDAAVVASSGRTTGY